MPTTIEMYADLVCPYAYLTAWRLRRLRDRLGPEVTIVHASLSLEYVNNRPTPRFWIGLELPLLMCEEPELPWQVWSRPEAEWPVTVLPAFEAVKCAERQSMALAHDLDWALRHALHAESRTIALRHEILACAEHVGLDMARFTEEFDSGVAKRRVIEEARAGWEQLRVQGSPTLVFPNGAQAHGPDLGLPTVTFGTNRTLSYTPGGRDGEPAIERLLRTIEAHLAA